MGQGVFAIGFALAGAHGMGRKLYGAEQNARSVWQQLGLAVMGFGGLVAIIAGLLFLAIVVSAWLRRERARVSAWESTARIRGGTRLELKERTGGSHG